MAMQRQHADSAWRVLHAYFQDTPYFLTKHHLDTYDGFVERTLAETIRSMNPIDMVRDDGVTGKKYKVRIMVGERSVSMDRPTMVDPDGAVRPLYPNEARLKDLTYAANLYADVTASYWVDDEPVAGPDGEAAEVSIDNVHIGEMPIMLHSRMCLLRDMPPATLREMGECPDKPRRGHLLLARRARHRILLQGGRH